MKKFSFSLEQVLKLRSQETDLALEHLSNASRTYQEAQAELEAVSEEIRKASELEYNLKFEISRQAYIEHLERKRAYQELAVKETYQEMEVARFKAGEAQKAQSLLEKMRKRQFKEWQISSRSREEQELSEMWRDNGDR